MLISQLHMRTRRVLGAGAVLGSLLAPACASVLAAAVARSTYRTATRAPTAEELLVGLAAAVCALLCAHLLLLVIAGVLEGVRRSRHSGAVPPATGRLPGRAVSAAVAALVITTLTVPAAHAAQPGAPAVVAGTAAPPSAHPDSLDDEAVDPPLPGSWAALSDAPPTGFVAVRGPSAPATADLVTAPPSRTAVRDAPAPVVVVAGSSLWSIAAAHLGPGATDTEVAAAWPRWWEANRDVIGDDPDVLLPGQQLRPPDAGPAGGPGG